MEAKENLTIKPIGKGYLLAHDKNIDTFIFDKCATSEEKLKKLLIDELFKKGEYVCEESIKITYKDEWNELSYKYNYLCDFDEDIMYFVEIDII